MTIHIIASIARCELNSNMYVRRWINILTMPTGSGFWDSAYNGQSERMTGNNLLIRIKNNYPV
jgi:hypothetical protein